MDRPEGFVSDSEQEKLLNCVADIKREKPFISMSEYALIYDRWDEERYFTIAECKEVLGVHVRIEQKKKVEVENENM